jgi:xylulokinase
VNPVSASYLGIDLGTSGLKLTLVGEHGRVLAESEASYDVQTPQPGFAETDPDLWMAALRVAAAQLPAASAGSAGTSSLKAVGVTGQMHGIVLCGADGQALRPAVLWPDQRATSVLARWSAMPVDDRAALANPIFAGMAGPMLTWLHDHETATLASTALVRSPKDWVRAQLTGDLVTERSDASATLLWDVTTDGWSTAATGLAGVRADQLPGVVDSHATVGTATWPPRPEGTRPLAPGGVPVVAGGADTACALSALQATTLGKSWDDSVVVNVGTGVQIVRPGVSAEAREKPMSHLYADVAGGWYEMLAVQNGGLALSWCQEMLGLDWMSFVTTAREAAPGSGGVSFVPFLAGERGGLAGPDSRAGWLGGSPSVGRAELARSAFEALGFTIRRGIELLGAQESRRIVVSGGGARDPWVRQLIADVLGRPITYVPLRSASATGAAVLAARGVGVDLPVTAEVVDVPSTPAPGIDAAYERWLRAVDAMAAYTG